MTLRELVLSVDAEQYADFPLYQELLKVKPSTSWCLRACTACYGVVIIATQPPPLLKWT